MIYNVQYGQTIYDILLATYGRLEYTFKLLQDNSFITSLDYDFDANPGAQIEWDETIKIPASVDVVFVPKSEFKTIVATSGQSIYDLCLMTYGDLKYLYKLMQDNNIISPNEGNISGKTFIFNTTLINDVGFYNYLSNKKKVINTLDIRSENTLVGKSFNISFNSSFY